MKWDLYILILALWNLAVIPFDVAFTPVKSNAFDVFERFVDACFAFDILINFRTTFINNKGFEVV